MNENELAYIGRTIVTFKWENTIGEHYTGQGPAHFVAHVWKQHPDVRRIYDIRIKQTKHDRDAERYYQAQR